MFWAIAALNAVLTLVGWMLRDWFVILGNGLLTVVFTIAAWQIERQERMKRLRRDAETEAWRKELERLANRGPIVRTFHCAGDADAMLDQEQAGP